MVSDEREEKPRPEYQLMPIFGGEFHGKWLELPLDPCKVVCGEYTIHCTMPPGHISGDDRIWFAGTEEALRTIRFDDIQYRYVEKFNLGRS